ncbi:MAG: GNAT family N-acetyltransferase [Firmicutes bacterium]|nr:GNAT family N-acetyltransferase [Bacillota bacterium]
MSFQIRKALLEDAHELAACHISAWQAAYKGIVPDEHLRNMATNLTKRAELFKERIHEKNCYYFLPTYDGKIIGMLVLWNSRDEDKPGTGEIGGFYLLEDFWGKGYGRKMMDFAQKQLNDMGCTEIFLWVLEENTRARQFYEKCGFTVDGAQKEIIIGGKALSEIRMVFT